jgi:3-hydroxybutyryl-CoA dehydrogenase
MNSAAPTTVGVIGCGLMGSGIAEVLARAGRNVIVHEIDEASAQRRQTRIKASLSRAVRSGKLSDQGSDEVLRRITIGTELEALADAELVVEAASEDESVKIDLFRRVDALLTRDDAVLASNTSSIPIMKLGTATSRPEQVVGMHFCNPVPVLPLVEVVPSLLTSAATVQRVQHLAEQNLGKTVIHSQDRAGFIVNALLVPYLLSGIRMLESGFASAHDIDAGIVRGCAHPMGPLQLSDLIGLDTVKAIAESLYAEFKEPLFSPPPMLLRMVDAGLLGRKNGRGFYEYG